MIYLVCFLFYEKVDLEATFPCRGTQSSTKSAEQPSRRCFAVFHTGRGTWLMSLNRAETPSRVVTTRTAGFYTFLITSLSSLSSNKSFNPQQVVKFNGWREQHLEKVEQPSFWGWLTLGSWHRGFHNAHQSHCDAPRTRDPCRNVEFLAPYQL